MAFVRLFIVMVALQSWPLYQLDVKNVFLNGICKKKFIWSNLQVLLLGESSRLVYHLRINVIYLFLFGNTVLSFFLFFFFFFFFCNTLVCHYLPITAHNFFLSLHKFCMVELQNVL